MRLRDETRAIESGVSGLQGRMYEHLKTILEKSHTSLSISELITLKGRRDLHYMEITSPELVGYIIPFQNIVYLFRDNSAKFIHSLSEAFLDSNFQVRLSNKSRSFQSLITEEEIFQSQS